jgi:hypothetical protein
MDFWRGNLQDALLVAIAYQRANEQASGYTSDSALVAGWQELYDAITEKNVHLIYLKDERAMV